MGVDAIILAAGGSSRMGICKALLQHPQGGSMIEAHVGAYSRRCTSIIVVAGTDAAEIRALLPPICNVVENDTWKTTDPFHSLKLGLEASSSRTVVVTLVDTPPVRAADLDRLLQQKTTSVLSWQGKPGHPVLLGPDLLKRILAGEKAQNGLQELLVGATLVEAVGPDVLASWNTPVQWQSWQESTTTKNSC